MHIIVALNKFKVTHAYADVIIILLVKKINEIIYGG